jgi:hypothetical protein
MGNISSPYDRSPMLCISSTPLKPFSLPSHGFSYKKPCFVVIDFSYLLFMPLLWLPILEGRTNRPERIFEALFKGVSTRQNLRLGSVTLDRGVKARLFGTNMLIL